MSFKSWSDDQKKKTVAAPDGKPDLKVTGPAPAVATNKGTSPAAPIKKA